jgi:transglutaminase-like putative cysteine protease
VRGSRRYLIRHETLYEYRGEVAHADQLLHLTPRLCPYQTTLAHKIDLDPAPTGRRDEADPFGNLVTRLEYDRPHRSLRVIAGTEVEVRERPAVDAADSDQWEQVRDALGYRAESLPPELLEACRFRLRSPFAAVKKAFGEYARESFAPGRTILAASEALSRRIREQFTYAPGETTVATPLLEVLETKRGVCQDFAHLMIASLRSLGLAARYVSGYVKTTPGNASPSARAGGDASHAWVGVFCPPFGWIDLDPTNGVRVGSAHVTIGWGRDFGDVSPLRGIIVGGGEHSVRVNVSFRELEA